MFAIEITSDIDTLLADPARDEWPRGVPFRETGFHPFPTQAMGEATNGSKINRDRRFNRRPSSPTGLAASIT
jgi:hypothetical protein